mmetsp:Transcript_23641/g.49513  ORF Transcript_23641/g.49513 Transcript_23641/m.49513 type:complete len:437 (-) Transcript_23641:793-2103(-)
MPPPKPPRRPPRWRFSRFARITGSAVVTCHFYYIIAQTRRMSASLFPDFSRYDAPYLGAVDDPSLQLQRRRRLSSQLPKWLADYFEWHIAMRKKYPGTEILTDPNAPGLLIKACAYKCGGLHDRLGGLGWDLYFANQTRRIFMIHWCIPAPIEHYLVPNMVDWTLPWSEDASHLWDERLFSNTTEMHIHCDRAVGEWKGLFDGYVEYMQGEDFWEKNIDLALDRAVHGNYSKVKILRYKVLGVDQRLEQRLSARHNETDPIAWTDAFPAAFWTLFKPSEGLQSELDGAFRHLGISAPFDHSAPPFYAIHARIRHPRGHMEQPIESKIGEGGGPDKHGLGWEEGSSTRQFAIRVAQHALTCAQEVQSKRHPLHVPSHFFYADSEDLVTYMGEEYEYAGVHVLNMTGVEVLHIDRQQQRAPRSYYSAFIDLFIAAQAS